MKTCNIRKTLKWGSRKLEENNIDSPRRDAQLLLAHLLNTTGTELYVKTETDLKKDTVQKFKNLIRKRSRHHPVSYLTGETNFMGLEFKVNKDTLIPRPETEIMTEKVIKFLKQQPEAGRKDKAVLDLGTGCGNIGVTVAKLTDAKVTGVDISRGALKVAAKNAAGHGVEDKINFVQSDLFLNLESSSVRKFDVLVTNPPYVKEREYVNIAPEVKREPSLSLKGGKEGLDCISKIIDKGPDYIKDGGRLFMEIGFSQRDEVENLLDSNPKIKEYSIIKDYNKIDRIVRAGVGNGQ